jgi:phosphoglycerate dehydrogenase-like enzyme
MVRAGGASPAGARPRVVVQLSRGRFEQLLTPAAQGRLRSVADVSGPTGPSAPPTDLTAAEVLFMSTGGTVDRPTLEAAPRLRWIASANSAPPRLDYDAVLAQGITVTDSRRGFHVPVAEMALTHYLALMRDFMLHDRALHTQDGTEGPPRAQNREASFRRLGLLGFGGIGQKLARLLAPLEPELLVHDPYLPPGTAEAAGARPVSLEALFEESDAVFVLARPNPGNRHLVGSGLLGRLKPGAALVVVSRFWLVDEAALIERLRRGDVRAGLDVFEEEPLAPGHPLRALQNVTLTPHRAGGTVESYWRIGQHFVEDVVRFAAGLPPQHMAVVDAEVMQRQGLDSGKAPP